MYGLGVAGWVRHHDLDQTTATPQAMHRTAHRKRHVAFVFKAERISIKLQRRFPIVRDDAEIDAVLRKRYGHLIPLGGYE